MDPVGSVVFSKMHGLGNDVVILDLRSSSPPSADLCRALADRHTGIGCDMIIGIEAPRTEFSIASYRLWTQDGLPSLQCGNGARCIAAWLQREGTATVERFFLDSPNGTHAVEVIDREKISIKMGVPVFEPGRIPLFGFAEEQSVYNAQLEGDLHLRFGAVSMGNAHVVIQVADVRSAPIQEVGRRVQRSGLFSESVNVGFAQIVSRSHIRLRVYEFGAGETRACGSGACAAAAVLNRAGLVDPSVTVSLPGGDLLIHWPDPRSEIVMTGPAAFVCDGTYHAARAA